MYRFVLAMIMALLSWPAMAGTIVVMGDSIGAGYGVAVDQSWVALLQQKLKQHGKPHVIRNESISGDTSAGGLARIDAVLARWQPAVVLLELGGNDGLRGLSPAEMQANLTEIIRRCRAQGAKVLLLGMRIPPNYGKRYVDLFYGIYPQLAKALDVPLVPFILESVALNPDMMQADGLHPNALGQPEIVLTIWPHLLTVLASVE
ncbi:MAG: arylesterase [Methylomonas sp.]|nr:arylesterase [Methylomonas sp.]PPD21028.1 MAG: arylesterase [Methylomonas sp.]PPD27055.1 MAG: arylesterase [Methylomonas sp.]PPD38988.1 MAG: arylesterase [Methylomonas sp.]PPD40892.1 MAG: arylesterase [Methylomonas sp.]